MTVMTAQLPLAITAPGGVPIGLAACLVEDGGGGRVVINGQLWLSWDATDSMSRRLAAVHLVRIKAATQIQVAAAFSVNTSTLFRWQQRLDAAGAAGLVGEVKGPRGPSKITGEVAADIRTARAAGDSYARIKETFGVSAGSIAAVLRHRRADAAEVADTADAGGVTCNDASSGADGQALAAGSTTGDATGGGPLPVLAVPPARPAERAAAHAGVLDRAAPVFHPAARVPLAGLLLAIPALVATGLIDTANNVYGGLKAGFYGLESTLIEAAFRALAGEGRAEGATRIIPADLGRVLGLDRGPEVTTIRRKIGQLAARGLAGDWLKMIGAGQLHADDDVAAVVYIDGHTRVYHGAKKIQKQHVSRLRFPAPATAETWITDGQGQPVAMVMAKPGNSLTGEIRRAMPHMRAMIGDGRRLLVGFDREGFSPALFADMIGAGFDVVTWRKGSAPDIDSGSFQPYLFTDDHGVARTWMLADTTIALPIDEKNPGKNAVTLRQITKQDPHTGRQVHILTSRTDLAPAEVAHRMSYRWRQENHFRYGRMHLALDAHETYAAGDDDGDRMVPNPAKKQVFKQVTADRARLARAEVEADRQYLQLRSPAPGTESVITSEIANTINAPVLTAETQLAASQNAHRDTPARIPLKDTRPGQQVLDTETKLVLHAIRSAVYNTQMSLARAIKTDTGYKRAAREAHALIRQTLKTSGDIDPQPGVLHVRLDPLPTARQTKAIAELCQWLNATETVFPDTNLKLHYSIKSHT